MGFLADWAAHWRYMWAETKSLSRDACAHPAKAAKNFFISPLMFALVFFLVTCYFNSVLSVISERQGNNYFPQLEDEGFEELGPFIDFFQLPNYLLYALLAFTAFRFLPIWPCVKPALFRMVARRWLVIEGVIFLFRGFSVSMTSVPQPNPLCVSTAMGGNVWSEGIYITFGIHHTCGDCMFSGHTAATTLLIMIWTHYSRGEELAIFTGTCQGIITSNTDATGDPMGWTLSHFILWAYGIVSFYFIIATRFHYSHDVFLGFLITYYFFKYYHFYIKALALRQGSFTSRFMRWFESIDLAEENLRKERDLEAGAANTLRQTPSHYDANGVAIGAAPGGANSTLTALGYEATKHNAILGSAPAPPATLLPVSYLEGQEYYKAGAPDAGEHMRRGLERDHAIAGHTPVAGGGAGVNQAAGHGGPVPASTASESAQDGGAHNFQRPVGVLVAGEHNEQERREVERETGVKLHY